MKKYSFVATNLTWKSFDVSLKISNFVAIKNGKKMSSSLVNWLNFGYIAKNMSKIVRTFIKHWSHAYKCWNTVSNRGHWLPPRLQLHLPTCQSVGRVIEMSVRWHVQMPTYQWLATFYPGDWTAATRGALPVLLSLSNTRISEYILLSTPFLKESGNSARILWAYGSPVWWVRCQEKASVLSGFQ